MGGLLRRGVFLCFLFSAAAEYLFLIGGVNFSMRFERAVIGGANPDVVLCVGDFVCYAPIFLSKCSIGSFASSMVLCFGVFAGGCSFRGIFHLVVCVLSERPWTEALRPTILVLWCFSAW